MNTEKLEEALNKLTTRKTKLENEVKDINKKAKEEVLKRKPLMADLDQKIYIKELEIKVSKMES